jgi:hypothetical protein
MGNRYAHCVVMFPTSKLSESFEGHPPTGPGEKKGRFMGAAATATVNYQSLCRLVQDGFETPLEQRAYSAIFPIQPDTVADIKPMDGLTQIGFRSLKLKMIVVRHQHMGVGRY